KLAKSLVNHHVVCGSDEVNWNESTPLKRTLMDEDYDVLDVSLLKVVKDSRKFDEAPKITNILQMSDNAEDFWKSTHENMRVVRARLFEGLRYRSPSIALLSLLLPNFLPLAPFSLQAFLGTDSPHSRSRVQSLLTSFVTVNKRKHESINNTISGVPIL
nr:DNA mismatch repair protein PMS1 [Tanacetum cinerariifolium]